MFLVRSPVAYHSAGFRWGTATFKFYDRRDNLAVTVTAAATVGFLTITGSLPLTGGAAAGGSAGVSVEVSVDLNQAVAALAVIGFHSRRVTSSGRDCATSSTGVVQRFLARHPCDKIILAGLTARSKGAAARIAISWVTMSSTKLATRYKHEADSYGSGNPPEPAGRPRFNGLCYASGQNGVTVWTAQIQPIGLPSVRTDREILRDVAPGKLAPGYLQRHCID